MPRRSKRQNQLEQARGNKLKEPQREEDNISGPSSLPGPSTSLQPVDSDMLPRRSKRLKQTAINREQESTEDENGKVPMYCIVLSIHNYS